MPAPHKTVLKELVERFEDGVSRFEAAVERLEAVAPHSTPPTDPAALEAAERYITQRAAELDGLDPRDVPVAD